MAKRHPETVALVQQCTQDIKDSKLSLSNPCQYCGQTFQRKDAHLRACVGVFNGVYLHRRLARGKPLALTGTGPEALIGHVRHENDETRAGAPVRADDGDTGAPPSPKPRQPTEGTFHSDMGYGNGPGRSLRGQGTAGYATSEVVKAGPKRRSARQRPKPAAAPAITLKRLWEKQRPAAGDYEEEQDRRSRHLLESIRDRFQAMMGTSSSRSKATELGWISSDGKLVHGLKWDPQQMRHTRDETVESLDPRKIEEALSELIQLAPEPLVVQRFHATRPLAAEYQSPVLSMFMEVGLRTEAAQKTWHHLNLLARSAVWAAGSCFLRHDRCR